MPAHAGTVRPNVNPPHSAAISARPASLVFGVVMGFLPVEVAPECTASRIEYQSRSRGRSRLRTCGVPSRRYFFFRLLNAAIHSRAIAWAFVIWDGFNPLAARSRYAAPLSLSFAAAI